MKKVLIVFDGENFSKAAFDFACRLNEAQPILLTGVFLPPIDYADTIVYYMGLQAPLYISVPEVNYDTQRENIEKFKVLCADNQMACRVHNEMAGSALEEIKKETRYADILLLSNDLFYKNLGSLSHNEYLHDTLHNAECPVVLLPEAYRFPANIILAYDGSESSVYAIKQFCYLFPELASLNTTMVYASEKSNELPDFDYIKEFAARHFPSLNFLKLDIDPKEYFNTWITDVGPALLVAGSYGRSLMSEMFKKSFVTEMIDDHKLPVFIAHK